MKLSVLLFPVMLILSSCSSPPKPPRVDESRKHRVNATALVELQVCKGELQNSRILATEKSRDVQATRAAFFKLAALHQAQATRQASAEDTRSTVYTILFPFGSTRVDLPPAQAERLIGEARSAPLILLSGRTDGASENPAESRIARQRSEAVQSFLQAAGVAPARIRATWQPIGDHAGENITADGRSLNRRVEIEIYRFAPRTGTLAEADPS
ncbi:MAG: OmpA family protein [Caldimonas sp.]